MTPSGMWIARATPVRYTSSITARISTDDASVHASQAGSPMGGVSSPRLCQDSLTETRMWRGPLNTHTVGVGAKRSPVGSRPGPQPLDCFSASSVRMLHRNRATYRVTGVSPA